MRTEKDSVARNIELSCPDATPPQAVPRRASCDHEPDAAGQTVDPSSGSNKKTDGAAICRVESGQFFVNCEVLEQNSLQIFASGGERRPELTNQGVRTEEAIAVALAAAGFDDY